MRKGFTLVELLAVIAILGLLIGVSVPTYLAISSNINQSMAETKIQELKAKSEKYSEETGKSVFDVKSLIEAGVLSPDSELGEYKDPVTGRDMSCDIITIQYKNTGYEATITESDECYEEQYLENLFGMVDLYLENESGQEVSKNTWLKESKVNVRYRIKPEYQGKGIVSEVSWSGQAPVQCNSTEINTDKCQKYLVETYENGIKNVEVRLQIKITLNESGASFVSNVSAKVLLDLQRPKLVNNVDLNNEINTSGARRVTFELTDNIGSGVSGYAFTKDLSSGSCSRVSYKNATDGIQTDYLMSGFYGICVKDQVGNITNDIELQNSRFEVKEVDTSPPAISFTGNGIDGDHNWKKKFTITATARDNEGVRSAKYCITTSSTCIPDVDASLTSGSTTREFNVEMPDDKNPQTLCGQVTDLAGNMSEVKCSNFYKVDGKLPEQSFAMGEFKKGSGDWYKELKINVTGADEHSGIINGRYCTTSESMCNPNIPFTDSAIAVTMENGASPQTVCANFTDYAGNTSITTCMSNYYKIDGTNPTPNVSVGANTGGSNGWYKDLTVNITGSDDHSGVSDGIYCIEIGSTCTPNTPIPGSNKSVKLNDNSEDNMSVQTLLILQETEVQLSVGDHIMLMEHHQFYQV